MPYIGQGLQQGRRQRSTFTATASQTTFAHSYTVGYVDVYQNGILLAPSDYTATNGTQIVLAVGAALNDEITIISQHLFSVADVVSATGGTFSGNVTVTGNLTVQGSTITVDTATTQTVDLGDSDKIRLGDDNDLQIYHTGTTAYLDNNTGALYIRNNVDDDDGGNIIIEAKSGKASIVAQDDEGVRLYYDDVEKLETTNTGVTVTGSVTADGGNLILGNEALSVDAQYVGLKTSYMTGTADYMILSGTTANSIGDTFVSAKAGSNVFIRSGGNDPTHQIEIQSGQAKAHGILSVVSTALVGNADFGSYNSTHGNLMVSNGANPTSILLYNDAGAYQSSLIQYDTNVLKLGLNNSNSANTLLTTSAINVTSTGVGIGTDAPGYPLQVNGSVDILNVKGSTGNAFMRFTDSDATADFSIGSDDNSGAGAGSFILYDRSNTAYRLVVDSNGTLLVGRTADADSTAGAMIRGTGFIQSTRDGSLAADFNRLSSNGDIIRFQKDGSPKGTIGTNSYGEYNISSEANLTLTQKDSTDRNINFGTDHFGPFIGEGDAVDLGRSNAKFRNLYLSGGVYVGGTGSANYLDDYEEGSFTPTLSWYTPSNGSVSYIARTAYYIRVGRAVTIHLEMRLNLVSQNSATLPLLVDGFPFPFRNTGGYGGSLMQVSLQGFTFSSGHIPFGWGEYNSTRMFLFTMSSGNLNSNLPTPPNYKTINVSGTYITP